MCARVRHRIKICLTERGAQLTCTNHLFVNLCYCPPLIVIHGLHLQNTGKAQRKAGRKQRRVVGEEEEAAEGLSDEEDEVCGCRCRCGG
jgi:hypothetical protein